MIYQPIHSPEMQEKVNQAAAITKKITNIKNVSTIFHRAKLQTMLH